MTFIKTYVNLFPVNYWWTSHGL